MTARKAERTGWEAIPDHHLGAVMLLLPRLELGQLGTE